MQQRSLEYVFGCVRLPVHRKRNKINFLSVLLLQHLLHLVLFYVCATGCRLWFVYNVTDNKKPAAASPMEIGYMNVIPKCISSPAGKYPHYENLPETYVAINDYLIDSPLEG